MKSANKIAILSGFAGLASFALGIYSLVARKEADIDEENITYFFAGAFFEILAVNIYCSYSEVALVGNNDLEKSLEPSAH